MKFEKGYGNLQWNAKKCPSGFPVIFTNTTLDDDDDDHDHDKGIIEQIRKIGYIPNVYKGKRWNI